MTIKLGILQTTLYELYNTHIAQYLTKERLPHNTFWSVNRILQEKYFSSKVMQKMRQGD